MSLERKDLSAEPKIKPRADKGKAVASVQINTHNEALFQHTNAIWLGSQGLVLAHPIVYIIEKDHYNQGLSCIATEGTSMCNSKIALFISMHNHNASSENL